MMKILFDDDHPYRFKLKWMTIWKQIRLPVSRISQFKHQGNIINGKEKATQFVHCIILFYFIYLFIVFMYIVINIYLYCMIGNFIYFVVAYEFK